MYVQQDIASSFEHAIHLLYRDSWQQDLARFRSSLAFRGLSDADYELTTSLMRLKGKFQELEYHLIRNFRKYAQIEGAGVFFSDWKWITLGQHHGLPTRLLDWTYSPLVALHYVTADTTKNDRNGVVWCVDIVKCHEQLPDELRKTLRQEGSVVFTAGMLEKVTNELRDFDRLSEETFALFFEPPSMDSRIVNQFALFSVLSNSSARFDDWLTTQHALCRRVIIPAAIKWEIRDKLDQANMTERVLLPGLDGLAKWLSRHYSSK